MRRWAVTLTVLTLCGHALPKDRRPGPALPGQFEIGRHTFIDVGPPNDFYELFLVRPAAAGTSIERITLTRAADACLQPAKLEVASASLNESVATLLGKTNPCTIREKELRRELKRCKKCLVFSGANVQMRVQCGAKTHIIRSDILDKDMFDPAPNTPEHTSWTMQLLARLDNAVGPGVMERPIFPISEKEEPSATNSNSEALADVSSGKFDMLFQGAPDKPSELYHAAQIRPPAPIVRLSSSAPFQPEIFVPPAYPPLARLAHIDGSVAFTISIGPNGNTTNFTVESGHPMLRGVVENAVSGWRFPRDAAGQLVHATIEFASNCSAKRP